MSFSNPIPIIWEYIDELTGAQARFVFFFYKWRKHCGRNTSCEDYSVWTLGHAPFKLTLLKGHPFLDERGQNVSKN